MTRRFHNWMPNLLARPSQKPSRKMHTALNLEQLENRLAPAVFDVNTVADLSLSPGVNTATGEIIGTHTVTLRSAIEAANATPGDNTIRLHADGNYQISLAGTAGEVDNLAGEFAITSAKQSSLTIENDSADNVTVDGNNLSRVFDINPTASVGTVNVTAGGTGFDATSGITFSAPTTPGGVTATGTLDIVGGSVVGVTITNPGSGYTSADPPTISFTGAGTGAALNVAVTSPALSVTMSGFTIENGVASPGDDATGSGGGIRAQGAVNLTLDDMVVTNNNATADGGGVGMTDLNGSAFFKLTLKNDTTISNNHAGDAGGGIDTDGAGTVDIGDSAITANTDLGQGAGIYIDAEADVVQNITVTNGGTGYTSAPTVNIGGPGTGAMATAMVVGGKVTAVTIVNSGTGYTSAPTITFTGGGGSGATATASVLNFQSAPTNISNTLINANSAIGGGIGSSGCGISNAGNATITINQSTIEGNSTGGQGGGFSDENDVGSLVVTNSLFLDNTATLDGGAIQEGGPTTTITNSEFKGNSSGATGGALFVNGTTFTMLASTVASNTSLGDGGGIEIETTGTGTNASSITNSTITQNSALRRSGSVFGGGIDASSAMTGALSLLNNTINGNFASSGGGLYYAGAGGSTLSAQNTIIAANTSSSTGPDAFNAAGTFTDNGGNLIGVSGTGSGNTGFTSHTTQTGTVANPLNPLLGALTNNGGPSIGAENGEHDEDDEMTLETESPQNGSPVIGTGVVSGAPSTDERGATAIVKGKTNIGASSAGLSKNDNDQDDDDDDDSGQGDDKDKDHFKHSQNCGNAYDDSYESYIYAYDAYAKGRGSYEAFYDAYYSYIYSYYAQYYDSIDDQQDSENCAYESYEYSYAVYNQAYGDYAHSGGKSSDSYDSFYFGYNAYLNSYYTWQGN